MVRVQNPVIQLTALKNVTTDESATDEVGDESYDETIDEESTKNKRHESGRILLNSMW